LRRHGLDHSRLAVLTHHPVSFGAAAITGSFACLNGEAKAEQRDQAEREELAQHFFAYGPVDEAHDVISASRLGMKVVFV
jgi:hypothetical protein